MNFILSFIHSNTSTTHFLFSSHLVMQTGEEKVTRLTAIENQAVNPLNGLKRITQFSDMMGVKLVPGDTTLWVSLIQEIMQNGSFADHFASSETCSLISTTLGFFPPVEIETSKKMGDLVRLGSRKDALEIAEMMAKALKAGPVSHGDLRDRDSAAKRFSDGTEQFGDLTLWFDNRARELIVIINERGRPITHKLPRSLGDTRFVVERVVVNYFTNKEAKCAGVDLTLLCTTMIDTKTRVVAFTVFPEQLGHLR